MKRLIIFLILVLGAAWLGLMIAQDPGYVLLAYRHYSIEMTLWFALLALLTAIVLIRLGTKTFSKLSKVPVKFSAWRTEAKRHRAQLESAQALTAFLQGDWLPAKKGMISAAQNSPQAHVHLIMAAIAASRLHKTQERDRLLKQAHQVSPKSSLTISLTQAQLHCDHKQYDQALATLKQLQTEYPHNLSVIKQLAIVYWMTEDWLALAPLLPRLHSHGLVSKQVFLEMEINALGAQFKQINNVNELRRLLRRASTAAQQDRRVLHHYCQKLVSLGEMAALSKKLKHQLNQRWDDSLLVFTKDLAKHDAPKTLKLLLSWVKQHANNAPLYTAIGQCYYQQGLLGQAKNALRHSCELDPQQSSASSAWVLLSKISEADGDHQQALAYLKKALS